MNHDEYLLNLMQKVEYNLDVELADETPDLARMQVQLQLATLRELIIQRTMLMKLIPKE